MTVVSKIANGDLQDKVQCLGVCRDKAEADVPKFITKFHGKFMKETTGPNGEQGIDVEVNFPIAFDKDDVFNNALKKAMVKAVVGVGFVVLVDAEGKVQWYETFERGLNKAGLLHHQLSQMVEGQPLFSWGDDPDAEEEEEEEEGGGVPADFEDPFAATGDGY